MFLLNFLWSLLCLLKSLLSNWSYRTWGTFLRYSYGGASVFTGSSNVLEDVGQTMSVLVFDTIQACSCSAGEWCEVLWRKCRWDGKPQREIFNKESGRECDCEKGGRRQKANLRSLILRNNSVLQHLLFNVHVKSLCLWLSTTFSLYTQSPLGRKKVH